MLFASLAILFLVPQDTNAVGQGVSATDRMFESYLALGCWKDNDARVIPILEGRNDTKNRLDGHYKSREDAVKKCFKATLDKGFEVFAVQDGGACFSSADARKNYKKAGSSTECKGMKGGPMANSVYEISPLMKCLCLMPKKHNSLPKGKICFRSEQTKNSKNETALHVAAKFGETKCANILITSRAPIEAKDSNGKTPLQVAVANSKCEVVGKLLTLNADQSVLNSNEKVKLTNCGFSEKPETNAQIIKLPYKPLGCFRDGNPRSLDLLEGNDKVKLILEDHYKRRRDAINKCYKAAKSLGYKIFAVQDGGACVSSKQSPVTYNKYGKSYECAKDGKGGPMANSVYEIKTE